MIKRVHTREHVCWDVSRRTGATQVINSYLGIGRGLCILRRRELVQFQCRTVGSTRARRPVHPLDCSGSRRRLLAHFFNWSLRESAWRCGLPFDFPQLLDVSLVHNPARIVPHLVPVVDLESGRAGRRDDVLAVGAPLERSRVLGAQLVDQLQRLAVPQLNLTTQVAKSSLCSARARVCE